MVRGGVSRLGHGGCRSDLDIEPAVRVGEARRVTLTNSNIHRDSHNRFLIAVV